jgi:hypothetical protein
MKTTSPRLFSTSSTSTGMGVFYAV